MPIKHLIYSTLLLSTVLQLCFSDDYSEEVTTMSARKAKLIAMQHNEKIQIECAADINELRNCQIYPALDYTHFVRADAPPNTYLCIFAGVAEEGEGKTIVIAGDERAMHLYSLVKDEDVRHADAFVVVVQEGCTVFPTLNRPICSKLLNMLPEIIKKYEPEILIINQRLENVEAFKKPFDADEKADRTVETVTEYLQEYARTAKKIIIIQPFPNMVPVLPDGDSMLPDASAADKEKAVLMENLLWENKSLDCYHFNPYKIDRINAPGWNRLKTAVEDCEECVIIETLPLFLRETPGDPDAGKQYIMYSEDRESYLCDGDLSHKAVQLYMNSLFQAFESNGDEPLEDPAPYDGAPVTSVWSLAILVSLFMLL